MPHGMGNSSAESRYTNLFSAHRGCGTFTIVIPAERLTWPRSATGWAGATAKRDLPVDVRFSLLGPVRAWRGPAEVDLGPNQQRAIVALLLVRANQLVATDDLIELLWERNPPGSAINAIHKYIGAIRRLLEPDLKARTSGRWLTRQGGAYRLAADESTSDLIAFRRMVKGARSARAGDRPADALDLLMAALGLRRGACSEGPERYGPHRDYFTAVDQEYATAVAEAADAALACAQPLRILPLLRQVASDEPLNESLQARLMLLLAATGQQALALSHYQAVRVRLSDELGVAPGTEMCTALGKVLRQELPMAGAGTQAEIASAPGSVRLPDPQAARICSPPGVPSPLVPPAQLPADLPMFAGREPELSQVSKMLSPGSESPLVAICAIDGMAGIGKTTFAIHLAHHLAKHFEDGQLYLNLHGFDSSASATPPADALGTLLCSLGLPAGHVPHDLDARAGLYRSVLAGKHVLIVLDNAAEPEAVEEIIHLCGRLPLALAIVAARAAAHPDFTLASIATDLRRTRGRLDAFGTAGVAADVRTVFSWSYRHLTPQACRLFRLLSLQPAADITFAASASLLGDAPETANRLMAELTSTALITEHQPGRYAFHELTRAYAAELSDSTDTDTDRHEALARILDHYQHSRCAAEVELKSHRESIAPSPPLPGVTPEQFSDYASAIS
jgi:DNA-binding SARP family transcriptional activator